MPPYYFEFDIEDGHFAGEHFIVAELAQGVSLRWLFDRLYQLLPPERRSNSRLIVRPAVKYERTARMIQDIIAGDPVMVGHQQSPAYQFLKEVVRDAERTLARFERHDIRILASEDYAHFLTDNINRNAEDAVQYSAVQATELLSRIRDAEIDHLIETGMCKLPPLKGLYYKVPSGRCVKSFLRVGNLQISRPAIDAIFFWLLPHLRDCVGVVTDTWSISSLSQNVSRRLVDYTRSKRSPCPIEMLGDYHANSEEYAAKAAETIKGFISRIGARQARNAKVLFLISATHSASMLSLLPEALGAVGVPDGVVQYVSIFRLLPTTQIPTLRDFSADEDFTPVELTAAVEEAAVLIHPTLYFPLTAIDVDKHLLVDSAFPPYREFLERYKDIEFARVHRNDPLGRRHHGIWIDTPKLVAHPAFRERFTPKLLDLDPTPSLIVHPDHPAGHALAELAADILGQAGRTTLRRVRDDMRLRPELSEEDAELTEIFSGLGAEEAVLFLDDAFVTGTRIAAYQKAARNLSFKGTYHYLTAIARPNSEGRWRQQKRAFCRWSASSDDSRKNRFECVEMLILPDWTDRTCPWCAEEGDADRLRELSGQTLLRDSPEGLADDIFVVPPGAARLALRSGSFIGPSGTNQANVFCAVAGGLQRLRTEKFGDGAPKLGARHFMVGTILATVNYTRYLTDSVLMASILKAANASELTFQTPQKEAERTDILSAFMKQPTNHDLIAEFELAALRKKVPHLRP